MRQVYYCVYLSEDHLRLIVKGWKELQCIIIEDDFWVKMVSP